MWTRQCLRAKRIARADDPYTPLRKLVSRCILRRMKTDKALIAQRASEVRSHTASDNLRRAWLPVVVPFPKTPLPCPNVN
jgi:hypothetical protein